MALTVPSGMAAWPLLPQPRMTVAPPSPASKVTPSVWTSAPAPTCTVQEARSGTALWATPPSNAVMTPFSNFGLTSSPLKPPFSPLQTGNSASGVKQKAGIG